MTKIQKVALACVFFYLAFSQSASATHRTGKLIFPELLVAGDLNEDGNPDIAVNATGFDNVAILLGDGQGQFALSGHIASDTLPRGLAIGDVNRDGHLDLVQCNEWGYNAILHLGDGLGGFGERDAVVNGEGGPRRVILADFNRDRNPDVAVAGPDEGVILIYLGDGKGGFTLPPEELADLAGNFDLIAADFNGDRNLDIATTTGLTLKVFLGDGTGSFTLNADLEANPQATTVMADDLNNDGKLDLVLAGAGPGSGVGLFMTTYLGDGAGSFTLKQDIELGAGNLKGKVAVGDFNEDGNPDVAFPRTELAVEGGHIDKLILFFGDGTGNLVEGPFVSVGQEPHSVITTDFNKDGHLDLAVSNRSDGTVSVFLGDGSANFTLSATVSVLCPICLPEG